MKKRYYLYAFATALLLGSCGEKEMHDEHDHDAHHETEAAHEAEEEKHVAGEVVFKRENAEAIGLKTQKMTRGSFAEVIQTSGRIEAAQGSESVLVATVPGVVTLGKTAFVEGTLVRKGEAIVSLASNVLSDGDVAIRTKNAYLTAQKEFERMEQLVDDQIVSRKEYEQARLAYENAKVAYEAIKGKESARGVAVTAPLNGFLKNILVKEGDYVAVGQPLATISQNGRLRLRADVSEKYYTYLPQIQSACFKTPYDEKVYRLDELDGRLISYGKASDANSFYVPVLFEFANRGAIIPGSFVEVYLLGKPMEQVLSVPLTALVEEQGLYSVYLRLDEDCYKKQYVTLGANDGQSVQILSGLKEGEEVVTEGAYQIKLASASNAIPAHTHHH